MFRPVLLSLCAVFSVLGSASIAASPVTIFAASSTQTVVDRIAAECAPRLGVECRTVYAASSTLARQIANGAPADIFLSANKLWLDYLEERSAIDKDSEAVIASNVLVVIVPIDRVKDVHQGAALKTILAAGRIAMGDPDHVPAGIYAKEALISHGLWSTLEQQTLRMPNVRAALTVVDRNEATSAIVYATDADIIDGAEIVYRFDPSRHSPIEYFLAAVRGASSPEVDAVYKLFRSDFARKILKSSGFLVGVAE